MNTSRRSLLAAGAAGTLALTAGCLDFVLGDGPLELSAQRVAPTDAALEDTEYDEKEIKEESFEETVEMGVERDVRASVWASVYSKEIEYQETEHEGSFFAAVSIPDVSMLGRSANPLGEMSNQELLNEFLGEIDDEQANIRDIRHEETFSLDILGESRDVDAFTGKTDLNGEEIDVEIKLTTFAHEDDLLVLLGSYPAALAEESANVEVLMESVEHPA